MIDSRLNSAESIGSLLPGNRYRRLNLLGAGGMGSIYRALDRLTGETVALKRVTTSAMQPVTSAEQGLALAHEFQALAGLRHPHIIAVRDYGFDQSGQPYCSMELLAQPGQWREQCRVWSLARSIAVTCFAGPTYRPRSRK